MEIRLRHAASADAAAIAALLAELGYAATAAQIAERMAATSGDAVVVAEADGAVQGVLVLHVAPMLHLPHPVARITALATAAEARGKGIGRRLVEEAASLAREAGCRTLELTTARSRDDAHAFYRRLGFRDAALRFHLDLTG